MASTSEIRRRIGSVRQTQKITHAMYLISQAKLRKAKQDLSNKIGRASWRERV